MTAIIFKFHKKLENSSKQTDIDDNPIYSAILLDLQIVV